ncbi:MAG: glycosyltransferase family 2 protein [Candidatus Aegiribacteria sp.]|nr:glycosyltransferase family 2 protein [Candidatus Aegiribacteria sp.]
MKVSVIIPVYNAEQFLKIAVMSALDQAETAEVILAEDNSADDSLDVCRSLEKEYQRVSLVRHPDLENHGAGATRNLGVRNVTMEYLAFLDADDFYLADRFKVAAELFSEYENIDGVYEAIGVCFEDEEAENRWISYENSDITTLSECVCPDKLCDLLLEGGNGTFSLDGLTVKRSIFKKCGYFFENLILHQDTAMTIQMAQFGSLHPGRLDAPVAMRRVHSGNRSISNYDRNYTSSLMWKTLFEWSIENRIQIVRITAIFLQYLYFIRCNVIDRRSGNRIDLRQLRILILETLKHPILSARALKEHFRRKIV